MLRRFAFIVYAGLAFPAPSAAQEASTVAGRPALSTTTTQDLIAQREKWDKGPAGYEKKRWLHHVLPERAKRS